MNYLPTFQSLSITQKMYGWSKWGGGTHGLVTQGGEWYCQICGGEQVDPLPSYVLPFDTTQRDFGRICTECKAEAVEHHIVIFWDLYQMIKKAI